MESRNSHGPLPTLPFRVNHFSLFTSLGYNNKHEHKLLLIIATILLVHEKEVLPTSGTYYSSSTDNYQLSITHLIV
jgi:hypothetical protein